MLFLLIPCATAQSDKNNHSREFWRQIVHNNYQVPAGESASSLMTELNGYLGSPDPELRDEFANDIAAAWIYRDNLIPEDEIRRLLRIYEDNLQIGISESEVGDAVLRRSFSALSLSTIAALDNKKPFLSEDEFHRLLASAIQYMNAEHDLRGYDRQKGWIHATAHTSDLLKFLGRSARLSVSEQTKILDAIGVKLHGNGQIFVFGENERMAAAVVSLARRRDFDQKAFAAWLKMHADQGSSLWTDPKLDLAKFATMQNTKDLLRSLLVQLSLLEHPEPSANLAKDLTLSCLRQLR